MDANVYAKYVALIFADTLEQNRLALVGLIWKIFSVKTVVVTLLCLQYSYSVWVP